MLAITGCVLHVALSAGLARADDAPAPVSPCDPRDGGEAPVPAERRAGVVPEDPESNRTVVRGRRPTTSDRTQGATEVDGAHLRSSPSPTLFETLAQASSGIHVTRRGIGPAGVSSGAAGGLTVRGLGGSPNTGVVVVEDGVPDVQGVFGHPLPDAYVPALLEEVVVAEGGDSVLYGTNAMGAALLLRSRWRQSEGWEAGTDAAYGSFDTFRGTAMALVRRGAWDGALGLTALRTDGHRDGAGGADQVAQAAVRYRFGDGWSATLRNKLFHVTGGDPGTVDHPYVDHTFDVVRNNVSATLELDRPGLRVTVRPWADVGRHVLYDGFRSLDWTAGVLAEAAARLHPDWTLLLGLEVREVDGRVQDRIAGTSTDLDATVDFSIHQQATWRPLTGLSLIAGTREQYSLRYGFVFAGKLGVRYDVWRGLYVRSRVARNFRHPTLRELYLPYPVANPELRPETSLNADVAIGWESRHLEVEVTGFRSQAKDLIKYFGSWPAVEVINIDRMVVWGIEGRVAVRDLGPFGASVSGTWQDAGRYTRQNPSTKLDFSVGLAHAFGASRIEGTLVGEWVHGLYMNNYGRDRLADPFFLDLSIRYRYAPPAAGWAIEPYLHLRNLLDSDYAYIAGYAMPGINALAGVRIPLGGAWEDE